jgi:hypothetical protein
MSLLYHRTTPPAARKVLLASPCTEKPEPGYAFALFESALALERAGFAVELAILQGDCHVDDARNRLVRLFLMGDCTDFMFLDVDLRWDATDLLAICKADCDVVGATYPLKQEEEDFPVAFMSEDQELERIMPVRAVPTGFLRIRRHVLERLAKDAPQFLARSDTHTPTPVIFERTVEDGRRRGGDYTFCCKWREAGGSVHLMPHLYIEHTGAKTWKGSLWFHQQTMALGVMGACLAAIREGRETNEVLQRMVQEWGNESWSASGDLLATAIMLARKVDGPILDCGSGLTTLAMAAANPNAVVYSLENDKAWVKKVNAVAEAHKLPEIEFACAPLSGGWYRIPSDWPQEYALAVIDGPSRTVGHRGGAQHIMARTFLFDDANDPNIRWLAEETARARGVEVAFIGQPLRPLAIVYSRERKHEPHSDDERARAAA